MQFYTTTPSSKLTFPKGFTTMASQTPKATLNLDIHSLVRRINRFIVEMNKSQSSGVSQTMPFDMSRVLSYTANLRAFIAHVTSEPLLDLPETAPIEMPLPESPSIKAIENESIYDICMLLETLRDEMANSQSSRLPTNMMQYDVSRAVAIITKLESLVRVFITTVEPLDLPDSSPMAEVTGPGRQGI